MMNMSLAGPGPHGSPASATSLLLVEDDEAIAEMYRLQLEADGYQVNVAATGEDACRDIERERYDLILLDIRLPGMDGFGVISKIRSQSPAPPPVVFLTNYGDPKMMEAGMLLGALDYVIKSRVTPAELSRSVPGWLARTRGCG